MEEDDADAHHGGLKRFAQADWTFESIRNATNASDDDTLNGNEHDNESTMGAGRSSPERDDDDDLPRLGSGSPIEHVEYADAADEDKVQEIRLGESDNITE